LVSPKSAPARLTPLSRPVTPDELELLLELEELELDDEDELLEELLLDEEDELLEELLLDEEPEELLELELLLEDELEPVELLLDDVGPLQQGGVTVKVWVLWAPQSLV
jgi:hypothetical protein